MSEKAMVLCSGGVDSTTCLALAIEKHGKENVCALSIYYGAHHDDAAGNAYPDCSEEFVNAMNHSIVLGSGGDVRIEAPFVRWNKAQIVAEGLRLQVPYQLTWSCYEGGDKPCGKCGTCLDRIRAFEANGVTDPAMK